MAEAELRAMAARDGIYTIDFLPATREGLRRFVERLDNGFDERFRNCTPENWAWLWFQLREAEDRPEWFPHGKAATLQHIEAMLIECAKGDETE